MLSAAPDDDGDEDCRKQVLKAGEQIARWTRARELALDGGTRKWFREAEIEEKEGKVGLYS